MKQGNTMSMDKHYEIFRRNFPFIVRNENEALAILHHPENKFIDIQNEDGKLIAASVINKNTIFMLCVDKPYRKKGIGTALLKQSEEYIFAQGYENVTVGAGDDYLMPGIPMATKPYREELNEAAVYPEVSDEAYIFFKNRGYVHAWDDANCFDMKADLENAVFPMESVGDTLQGIEYRFASVCDIPDIIKCTDDAEQGFSRYYRNEDLYQENARQRVLIAASQGEVCGVLIVGNETEAKGLGSVGCTAVSHKYRGRHIGVNMVILGTKYLKSLGLKNGFLGYTYSGLDKMYGYAGYKICIYYAMAQKRAGAKE